MHAAWAGNISMEAGGWWGLAIFLTKYIVNNGIDMHHIHIGVGISISPWEGSDSDSDRDRDLQH